MTVGASEKVKLRGTPAAQLFTQNDEAHRENMRSYVGSLDEKAETRRCDGAASGAQLENVTTCAVREVFTLRRVVHSAQGWP